MEALLIEELKIACLWLHHLDGRCSETRKQIAAWQELIDQAESNCSPQHP